MYSSSWSWVAAKSSTTASRNIRRPDDEYTPAERRIIDAQLDEAEKGPLHGPFNTADQAIAHIKGEFKKRAAARRKRAGGRILPVC
jgi:hypothetical protein